MAENTRKTGVRDMNDKEKYDELVKFINDKRTKAYNDSFDEHDGFKKYIHFEHMILYDKILLKIYALDNGVTCETD